MMNDSEITVFIENPGLLKSASLEQIEALVNQFPYFQTAHMLFLKALKDNNADNFQLQLEKSSIYISDRDLLFKFLNTEFKTIEKREEEKEKQDNQLKKEEEQADIQLDKKLLRNKDVKRKINESIDGMGANISETISSQIEFSALKKKDKLEYPPEIYFIEEEREGKNHTITIDAEPDNVEKQKKQKEILDLEEQELKKQDQKEYLSDTEDAFELIDSEDIEEETPVGKKNSKSEYFDINNYADEDELELKDDLITRFIEKNPRIKPKEISEEETIDISEDSVKEDSNLLSETLIKVYIKQGLFDKAIESYKKLSLKYPEKSSYFASQIKILEDKINN